MINENEAQHLDKQSPPKNPYTQQSPETEMVMLPYYQTANGNRIHSGNSQYSNDKWRPGFSANYYRSHSIAIPLPTHLETDSAEPSPTQAFGPKIDNLENLPGTAMHKTLGLHLSAPPTPESEVATPSVDDNAVTKEVEEMPIVKSQTSVLEDQFAYKQLVPYEKTQLNSKETSLESSLNGSYYNSRKESKRNSMEEENQRRISKQDREGLDSESLMFRDGRRKVDMVLAWEEEDLGVMTELESRKRDSRKNFMENLIKEGLEVELEDKTQSFNECTYFLKIHLPWRLETRLAEVMNLKLPVKRFITISVKASWVCKIKK